MKFIQLDILNLASLDRPSGETINFEEGVLGDSTIFSIVGPTGSGKSTLLDAICLALYNRAPRYPRYKRENNHKIVIYGEKGENENNRLAPTDCRNILSKGKKDGYSKLTFLANNGIVYRAEWHIHFNIKNYEKPVLLLYKLSVVDGHPVEEPADWEELPQIIGLEYDQFLRTVLIAQGSFANFLTASEEERYRLLEKLVGCEDMYVRISSEIKQKKDEAVAVYNAIEATFSAIKDDLIKDPEELEALAEKIRQLEAVEKQIKEELLKVSEALKWFEQEAVFADNLKKFQEQLAQALLALEAAKADFDQLSLHDITLPAVAFYEDIEDCAREIKLLQASLEQLAQKRQQQEERIQQEEQLLVGLKDTAEKAKALFDSQKPHIDRARTIKGELAASQKALSEKEKLQKECEAAKQKAIRDLDDNLAAIRKVEKPELAGQTTGRLQEAKDKALQTLADLKSAIRVRHSLDETLANRTKEADELTRLQLRDKEVAAQLAALHLEALEVEVKTLRNSYALLTSANLEHCRQQLVEGEACPLCGATHHPYQSKATFSPVVIALSALLQEKETLWTQQTQLQQRLIKEQGEAKGRMKELEHHVSLFDTSLESLQQEWNALIASHPDWSCSEETLRGMEQPAKSAVTLASTLLEDFVILEREKSKTANLTLQKSEKEQAFEVAVRAFEKAKEEVATHISSLKAEVGEQDPDLLENQLNLARSNAETAVNKKVETLGKLREELEGVKGSLKTTEERKRAKSDERGSHEKQLKAWLETYNEEHETPLTLTQIVQLYASPHNWEEIRKQQQKLSECRTSAQAMLNNETQSHAQHQLKKPADSQDSLAEQKTKLENHTNAELVEAKTRMSRHETASAKAGVMQKELLDKLQRKTEWEEIAEAIGADGKTLRKIAQCYTLRFLVEHANAEIRKFNQRYELLQVKNSLGLRVIDHDRADDVRDITSLSGGETFIVSLGLALGLSSLSSRSISFENLFIDEGFGTLDPDTLATVIDSLAMLQTSQGKKVGVISHTDTMSERITTQIRIIKNGSSGSSHIEIYP